MHHQVRTVLNDMLFVFLLGLTIIIFVLLYHINPVGEDSETEIIPPGEIVAEIRWFPDDLNCDVDLWVEGPGDYPVGYSHLRGKQWNLLRDDLGNRNDHLLLNYEHAFTRGILPGAYTINAHMYRCKEFPVRVVYNIAIIQRKSHVRNTTVIASGEEIMTRQGEEITLSRFSIRDDNIVEHVHKAFKSLR